MAAARSSSGRLRIKRGVELQQRSALANGQFQAFATVAKVDRQGDCAERQHDQGGVVSGQRCGREQHGLHRHGRSAPTTRPAASRSRMPRRPAAPAPRRFGRHRPASFTNVTLSTAFDCVMDSSRTNATISTHTFGSQTVTAADSR